jgi:uncharacterized HAD superfamily protein
VTSRPIHTRSATIQWLLSKRIPFDRIVFTENKKLAGAAFTFAVDDHYDSALILAQKSRVVFLFDYPWNRIRDLPSNIVRVSGWKALLRAQRKVLS